MTRYNDGMNARTALVAIIFLLALTALPATAQTNDRYSEIPLPENLKSALKDRLRQATGVAALEAFQSTAKGREFFADLKKILDLTGQGAGMDVDTLKALSLAAMENHLESMIDPEQAKWREDLLKKFSGMEKPPRFNGGVEEMMKRWGRDEAWKILKENQSTFQPSAPPSARSSSRRMTSRIG